MSIVPPTRLRTRDDRGMQTACGAGLLLSVSVIALLASVPAAAQDCEEPIDYGTVTCTVPAGSSEGVSIVQFGFSPSDSVTLENDASLSPSTDVATHETSSHALFFDFFGLNGTSDAPDARGGPTITVTNNGTVTMTGTSAQQDSVTEVAPVEMFSYGGNGTEPDDNRSDGGSGGDGGPVTVTNNATIAIETSATQDLTAQLRGIRAHSVGGNGGDQNSGVGDQLGGQAGNGGSVTVMNAAGATVTLGTDGAPVRGGNLGRAIEAVSTGGGGGQDNGSGGSGSMITLGNDGTIGVYYTEVETGSSGVAGLYGRSEGGDGTPSFDNDDDGGNGATGGSLSVDNTGDITIDTSTTDFAFDGDSAAIFAEAKGGNGGTSSNKAAGGLGGGAGNVDVTNKGMIVTRGVGVSGIVARSLGGKGGDGNGDSKSTGGDGGTGGEIQISLGGTVSTTGTAAYGVVGQSIGGLGGGNAGTGGRGADGGATGLFSQSGTVTTTGDFASGIVLHSVGGGGGTGDNFTGVLAGSGGDGGNGGDSGQSEVTSATTVSTSGDYATGVLVQAIGGSGGTGGIGAGLVLGLGGDGGGGGSASKAIVNNTGAVTTTGYGSAGIIAQSLSGGGGVAGANGGVLSIGGQAGSGTNAARAYATNNGDVTTEGDAAAAITVQSIGGGGGSASGTAGIYVVGGTGSTAGNGGDAQVYHVGGNVTTAGEFSHGLMAQSIGGGGGSGGNVIDVSVGSIGRGGIGGDGSAGGDGGSACVANTYDTTIGCGTGPSDGGSAAAAQGASSILTTGDFSVGAIAQSIGGGGGSGGSAKGVDVASIANVQIGASGSAGGDGGDALAAFDFLDLETRGSNGMGVLVQSLGGGGGNGGNALAVSVASLLPVQVGGNAGLGGDGGTATTRLYDSSMITRGTNAPAVVTQSIGGGGGTGGSAAGYDGSVGIAIDTAVGGTGGPGGSGDVSSVLLSNTLVATGFEPGAVEPMPDRSATDSHAIVAQSIGGGGGLGGTATADAITLAAPTGEDVSFAFTISTAVGGSGGVGGDGAFVEIGLEEGSEAFTGGDGSIGILAQSIGGGGGDGGGASSLADTVGVADTVSVNVSTAIGGDGGTGGNSDVAIVGIDTGSRVETHGDHANAVVVQTISGGGGNGGVGSTSSNGIGGGLDVGVDIGLGGTGGTSGSNDNATVELAMGSSVSTFGANAHGVVAQAITGGGGTSQGGNIGLSASAEVGGEGEGEAAAEDAPSEGGNEEGGGEDGEPISATVNVNVGRSGGDSTTAGFVDITTAGLISTTGNDSDGVIGQSIGGSGGIGGSAGSDAGADDDGGGFLGGDEETSYTLTASAGGSGGTGGNGGQVDIVHSGALTTMGDWADGIVLQSIGGGGGTAGTATAAGSEATAEVNLAVGGTGGTGGDGGIVVATFQGSDASVATAGRGAHAVLIQSIGGGGGHGADGSTSANATISVGGGLGGSGGASGNGGKTNVVGDWLSASTGGDDAFALAVQSIGGGGGTGGAGSSEASDDGHSLRLSVGGSGGLGGNGGAVDIDLGVTLATAGDRAYGILAQSIGGGGGISGSADGATIQSLNINTDNGTSGNGGAVTVSLDDGTAITTAGRGAHAILAQSIGGGGGIVGDLGSAFTNDEIAIHGGDGSGGAVSVTVAGDIATTGDYAYGILAQSIGGGGGLAGDGNGAFAGYSGQSDGGGSGASGTVTIRQSGTITASGEGSVGIFAQSVGYGSEGIIDIEANGTVTGGTGSDGAAILTSGGSSVEGANAVVVGADAFVVAGDGGDAIRHNGGPGRPTALTVDNSGLVAGTIRLHAPGDPVAGLVRNAAGGILTGGSRYFGNVRNAGTLRIGDTGRVGRTRITGDLTQTRTGTLLADADFVGGRADTLSVAGDAALGGTLVVNASTLAPDVSLTVLEAAGTVSGTLEVAETRAVTFGTRTVGDTIRLEAQDTRFASAFSVLNGNQRNVGAHLDAIFDAGSGSYGTFLADLGRLAESDGTGNAYARSLAALSPGGSQAAAAAQAAETFARLDQVLSCPITSGETITLAEQSCLWSRVGATAMDQGGAPGYDGSTYGLAGGGQYEIRPDWLVGFAAGYQNARYDAHDGLSKADGDTGYVGAGLKVQHGGLLVSGAAAAAFGSFDTERTISVPGFSGRARGTADVMTLGGRVRAAYTFGGEAGYVRPFADVDIVHIQADGYTERGGGAYNLTIDSESQTAFVATPALEVGARVSLSEGWLARGYARGGVSFSTEDDWTTSASLADAPTSAGAFRTTLPVADVVARVSAGIQLSHRDGVDLTAEYSGAFGDDYSSHNGMMKFSFKF